MRIGVIEKKILGLKMSEDVLQCFDPLDATRDSLNIRSRRIKTREELRLYKSIILGHLTSSVFLPSIRSNGLLPDARKERAVNDGVPSYHESVYLCTWLDHFYLNRATENHSGEGIIVVVQIEISVLKPDESALSEVERETLPFEEQLFRSLAQFGACKHLGIIPIEKIIGIYNAQGLRIH